MATATKWGPSQSKRNITRGINFYSTASHGGYILSEGMNKRIPEYARELDRHYEEDCDWAIVVIFLPQYFEDKEREAAYKTLKNWHPTIWEKKYGRELEPGESYVKDRARLEEENASEYVVSSAWGDWHDMVPTGMVGVKAYRKADDTEGWFLVPADEYQNTMRTTGFGFVIDTGRHKAWFGSGEVEIVA